MLRSLQLHHRCLDLGVVGQRRCARRSTAAAPAASTGDPRLRLEHVRLYRGVQRWASSALDRRLQTMLRQLDRTGVDLGFGLDMQPFAAAANAFLTSLPEGREENDPVTRARVPIPANGFERPTMEHALTVSTIKQTREHLCTHRLTTHGQFAQRTARTILRAALKRDGAIVTIHQIEYFPNDGTREFARSTA